MRNILSGFGKLAVVALIAVAFLAGLVLTVFLSLRSPEIQVPDVANKTYLEGEAVLAGAGLDIRERAKRFKAGVQPGVILDQSPHAGEVVKEGQTVAVVVSRAPKEGEEALAAQAEEARLAEEAARKENEAKAAANANSNRGEVAAGNANRNENQNRERRRNSNSNANRNSNASLNGNRNANTNNRNSNANNRNAANANNRNAARPANANRAPTAPRNTNTSRPAGANANRRPNP